MHIHKFVFVFKLRKESNGISSTTFDGNSYQKYHVDRTPWQFAKLDWIVVVVTWTFTVQNRLTIYFQQMKSNSPIHSVPY